MKDANMLQLVLEMGGFMVLAIAVSFLVYWNLLGKKHRTVTQQKKIPETVHPRMPLARTSFQQ